MHSWVRELIIVLIKSKISGEIPIKWYWGVDASYTELRVNEWVEFKTTILVLIRILWLPEWYWYAWCLMWSCSELWCTTAHCIYVLIYFRNSWCWHNLEGLEPLKKQYLFTKVYIEDVENHFLTFWTFPWYDVVRRITIGWNP